MAQRRSNAQFVYSESIEFGQFIFLACLLIQSRLLAAGIDKLEAHERVGATL